MNRQDKEGKAMLLEVQSIFGLYPNIATQRPSSVGVMGAVTTQVEKIIAAAVAAGTVISGDTVNKENFFTSLVEDLFLGASATSGFASKPTFEQPILKAKVDFSLSHMLNINYNEIETFGTNVINAITPVIGSLTDYGYLPADLTRTNLEFADFLAIQNVPQTDITNRKTQNSNIHPFVKEGKRLLDEAMDPIMNTLIKLNPDAFKAYYNARVIHHFPSGTTVAEGFVYGPDGVTPLYLALVTFPLQGLTVRTKLDGSYRIPLFPHGVATPTATMTDFNPQTATPYEVKQGKIVHHNFIMTTI